MKNSFSSLGISPPILKALDDMGYEKPTEVQSRAIPHVLNQEDLIVMSKTGSGKTAVFGVSMLQSIDPKASEPEGLILTPTRELAVQVNNELRKIARYTRHKTIAVYGQHSMDLEIQALNRGVSIVTGTPGRVNDHIQNKNLKTQNIRFLVLDEADRMLDMGFLDQVEKIIQALPRDRITLLFSATIPNEIRRICRKYMKQPVTIEIKSETKTVDSIEQIYYRVESHKKSSVLNHLLLMERPESCMIFCNTKATVNKTQNFLYRRGYNCQALHGDIPQSKRLKTIQQFKQGEFNVLVATDVAARGIHIDNLSLVINYDVPLDKDNYIHRIGRTGRAGNSGRALTLVTSDDIMTLYAIEEHIGTMINEGELPTKEMYNEQKSEADKWMRANSINTSSLRTDAGSRSFATGLNPNSKRLPKPYSGPNVRKTANKQYPKRPNQHYGNQHYSKYNDKKYENSQNSKKVKKTEPVFSKHRQQRPVQTNTKAASKAIINSTVNTVNLNTETQKHENIKAKKSFIQRIIQKITGK